MAAGERGCKKGGGGRGSTVGVRGNALLFPCYLCSLQNEALSVDAYWGKKKGKRSLEGGGKER